MNQEIVAQLSWLDDITEADMEAMTAGERVALMWPLAVREWAKRGIDVRNQPFRRDVETIIRRRTDGSVTVTYSSPLNDGEPISLLREWLMGRRLEALTKNDHQWDFKFGDGLTVTAACLWRVLENGRVARTSGDDGHLFGLPAPVDCESWVNAKLAGATVARSDIREGALDFRIEFDSGCALELIADSSGYEAWQVSYERRQVVAMGGGSMSLVDPEGQRFFG